MDANPRRCDIWMATLDPVEGSEQGGKRPVLILQDDQLNFYSPVTIVVSLTSQIKKPYMANVSLLPVETGLAKASVVLTNQIRTLSKSRLIKKVGQISPEVMKRVEKALLLVMGMDRVVVFSEYFEGVV